MEQYKTPFSRAYWQTAARELRSTRVLAFAALVIALRVAVKALRVPIMENLYITIGFLPNALGSLVYGPVVALLTGAVSDTLGALLFPAGPYFPPFMLVEMLGSFLFALFLYRAPLTVTRIALSKFSVNLLCNLLLTPLFLAWMNGRALVLASLPRIAKNVLLLPLEILLLTLFLGAMQPILRRMGYLKNGQTALRPATRHYVLLVVLFILTALGAAWYYWQFVRG